MFYLRKPFFLFKINPPTNLNLLLLVQISLSPFTPFQLLARPIFLSFHLQIHYTRQVFLHHTLKFTQNVPSQLFPMLSSSPQPIKLPSSQQNPSQNTHPMLTRTELRTTSPNQKCSKMVILIIQLLML